MFTRAGFRRAGLTEDQKGINIVDLMMWLVIAALLLAAAIQTIGYYQKAALLYQMSSNADGAGTNSVSETALSDGVLDLADVESGTLNSKWNTDVIYEVEDPEGSAKPYIRVSHPAVTDVDVLYLFDSCGTNYKIGVNIVPKTGTPELADCGIEAGSGAGGAEEPPLTSTLASWGNGSYGQNGTFSQQSSPHNLGEHSALSGKKITAIDVGWYTSCAVADNEIYCWGQGQSSSGGNRIMSTTSASPVRITGTSAISGKTITSIAVGANHACVIADGDAYCWGSNSSGQLGNGTTTSSYDLVPVTKEANRLAGKTVTKLTLRDMATCAIANDSSGTGTGYCWGYSHLGVVGVSTYGTTTVPLPLNTATYNMTGSVTDISTLGSHTCAVAGGKAYCWGDSYYGQAGTGYSGQVYGSPAPVRATGVLAGKTISKISTAKYSSCATATTGEVYCWGNGVYGQLGNGAATDSNVPVAVNMSKLSGKQITAMSGGEHFSCVVADGDPYCWGMGSAGQLGTGGTYHSNVPEAVDTTGVLSGKKVTHIASGAYVSLAVFDRK